MKTRIVLSLILFLSVCLGIGGSVTSHGVADLEAQDSTIAVIAFFCKNDTMKYLRTQTELSIENGDTVAQKDKLYEEFMLIVRDSTADGYKIEFIPLAVEYENDTTEDMKSRLRSTLQEHFKGVSAVFSTDEYGTIKGLDNWKEIRDRMKVGIKAMCDSIYSMSSQLDSFMPRSNLEGLLTLKFSSEQGVMSAYNEFATLFSLHGNVFDIGQKTIDTADKDSSVTTVWVGYAPYGEYSFDNDYNILGRTVTKYTSEETSDMLGGLFNILMKDTLAGVVNKIFKDSVNTGMTITQLEDYHLFYNGWPCMMRTQKIVEFGNRTTVITDEIGWTYRAWHQYATKDDDPVPTSL